MLAVESPAETSASGLAEDTDGLFVGKALLHGDVLTLLIKTLPISG